MKLVNVDNAPGPWAPGTPGSPWGPTEFQEITGDEFEHVVGVAVPTFESAPLADRHA